jgi:serine protease
MVTNPFSRAGKESDDMRAWQSPRWGILALALGLTACGGGGGGSGGGTGGSSYTLSGTISVVETSAVDSDLNDPNQSGYKLNHNPADSTVPDPASAQTISTPVLLTGTVNQPGFGPAGKNYASGDSDDYFKVDLTAGQVVELEFAADETANDIDLYVFDSTGTSAGGSAGTDTRYECVTISRSGTYYINVYAASGASIYNLRIGAPGTGGSCDNATNAFSTTALLAKPNAEGSAQAMTAQAASAHQTRLGRAGVTHEVPDGVGPHRLHLPSSTAARRAGLEALTGRSLGSSAKSAKAQVSGAVSTAAADGPQSRIAALATTLRYAKALRASGAYAYVEPDWVMQRSATNQTIGAFPPDDRYYSYQKWHYEQIQLPAAINRIVALASQPTQRPIVAVIDSGVALDHPDIAPQLFSNGRCFATGACASNTASGDDVSTSEDSVFHGTHVAGTIAAATYDGSGVAGVAPMAQILPLNVFGTKSGASTSDIVNAILYAAGLTNTSGFVPARRADVINMSLGGSGTCSASFLDAITKARNAGVIVVAAAGNENVSTVGQPANCSGVIAVGATQADKTRAPYSNTGIALKVAAPGGNTGVSTTGNGQPDGIFSSMASITSAGKRVSTLGYLQGTSMASPHVAGVMALMRYVNKDLTVGQVDALLASASITDDLGTAGFDTTFGYGLINADKAVTAAISSTGQPVPAPAGQVVASPASLDFGSFQTTAVLSLAYSGSSSETVTSVVSSSAAMTVTRQASVGSNGLGPYTVSVDRTKLSSSSTYLTITVTLSPSRTFVIPVAVSKSGSVARSGGFGPVYVLLTDAATGEVLKQVTATTTSTGYAWSASGVAAGTFGIIAGTDLDNDGYICQRGEACGGYPVIEAVIDGQGVEVRGNRNDLNFQIAPLSGISALSTRSATNQGFRRLNRQP